MTEQLYQDMKKYIRFMTKPNYVNKINDYYQTYLPMYNRIIDILKKNPTVYTPNTIQTMTKNILGELELEKKLVNTNMIVKRKLQILLNNYYIFRNPILESQLKARNQSILSFIPSGNFIEEDNKAMDEAIILILRDSKLMTGEKLSPNPVTAINEISISKTVENYVQNTFYKKNPSYFTQQKINELIARVKNKNDIINVEGYEILIGVM